jgi:O-antigen ligase
MQSILEQLLPGTLARGDLAIGGVALALLVSAAAAALTQFLYQHFFENVETGSQIHRSFLLIGPSVTLLFITVQLSLPLSLGLLGALSIVRFRVPIKEPEEIGFLMVLIASSIVCATFSYALLVLLYAVVIGVLVLRQLFGGRLGRQGGLLMITLADDAFARSGAELERVLSAAVGNVRLEHLSGRDGQTHLNYAFRGRRDADFARLRADLAALCAPESVSVLFSRPGGL